VEGQVTLLDPGFLQPSRPFSFALASPSLGRSIYPSRLLRRYATERQVQIVLWEVTSTEGINMAN
jgi:hypothetical protein